jgi:HAMP domain-containing protein
MVLIVVGVVPLVTVSWKLIAKSRDTITTAEQQNQLMLAIAIRRELDLRVESFETQLQAVAQGLAAAVPRRGTIPREEIRQVLGQVLDERTTYVRYTYFEGQQVRSVSAGDHPEYLEPRFAASLPLAAEAISRHADPAEAQRAVVSGPILLETTPPRAALLVAAPVVSNGSFRGVLTSLVDLERAWDGIAVLEGKGHAVFALDRDAIVFARNDKARARVGESARESATLRPFLLAANLPLNVVQFELPLDGEVEPYIGVLAETERGWGIYVSQTESKVLWTVHDMEWTATMWTLALVGVAGLVALLLARTLSGPINRLAAASRALARGDYSARVAVRSRDEIGELAHTFNRMAAEIEVSILRLREANREINELFLGTIRALTEAIDAKDPYTQGHSQRVNRYSMIIAGQLGLSDAELREIHVASLLHDVGKIGIEDHILKKTSALTDDEFEIIKTHPVLGANIMAPIRQMKNMLPGLRHHHERCDGSGYPDRLERAGIPFMARIIAVADTFDAITTNRPYQRRMTFEQAVARINELKGPALDDEVVEAFNRACHAGLIRLGEEGPVPAPPALEPSAV